MSKWANELAPNLYLNYDDWYNNYIDATHGWIPTEKECKEAQRYFFEEAIKNDKHSNRNSR